MRIFLNKLKVNPSAKDFSVRINKRAVNKTLRIFGVMLAIMLASIYSSGVAADEAGSPEDQITRLEASAGADHTIKFQTRTGIDALTDTITLTFASGFDLSAIDFGDIDLSHGSATGLETEENLTDNAGSNRWGFSVSGQVITLSAPTDAAADEVSVADYVAVKIGANASGGVNQIVNPGSAGVYAIAINGTFGDAGAAYVPVISNDDVNVTAQVGVIYTAGEPGTGGGGNISNDTIAPQVEEVEVQEPTSNSVKIIWLTDEYSQGEIEYGEDEEYGLTRQDIENLFKEHGYNLDNLKQDTEYHFRVRVKDQSGNVEVTKDYFFRTLPVANVLNFYAAGGDGRIELNWQNPEASNMAGVRIIRRDDRYAESPEDGLVIYEGPGEEYVDFDVENRKWYFYTVYVFDTSRQYSSGAIAEAVPLKEGEIAPSKPESVDMDKYEEILRGLKFSDLEFLAANGTLRLESNEENNIKALTGSLIKVFLDKDLVVKKLKTIIAQVGDSSYLLKINKKKGKYLAAVTIPQVSGEYPIVVLVVVYEDGSKDTVRGTLTVEDYGKISGMPLAKAGEVKASWYSEAVRGVNVTLFSKTMEGEWGEWKGTKYFQYNPQVTDEQGEYGFMVPNGEYYMTLAKQGYRESITPVFGVSDNIINWDLHLDRVMKRKWYASVWWWSLILCLSALMFIFYKRRKREEEIKTKSEIENGIV
ncbi:MAG: hypothetical protein ABIJ91_02725 [Candidatus Kuenenbacteria bacterium]